MKSLLLPYVIATGESFQSLSFQFRISLNAVSYITEGCCNALVDELVIIDFIYLFYRYYSLVSELNVEETIFLV